MTVLRPKLFFIACFALVLSACGGMEGTINSTEPPSQIATGGGVRLIPELTIGLTAVAPASPSKVLFPSFTGSAAAGVQSVSIYADTRCMVTVGGGSVEDFAGAGIQARVYQDQTTELTARGFDAEGNFGPCTPLLSYVNDSLPPSVFGFQVTNPDPTNSANFIFNLVGDLADASEYCFLENATDPADCAWSPMPLPASRVVSSAQGAKTLTFYARDSVGNVSRRADANTVVLDTVAPAAPSSVNSVPATPSNVQTPLFKGALAADAAGVRFYSDSGCAMSLGESPRAQFVGVGALLAVSYNATTALFGRSFDAAGNVSACVHLFDYVHQVGISTPLTIGFLSLNPASPSSDGSPELRGYASADIVTVNVFSDSSCSVSVGSGSKADFEGVGITLSLPANQLTAIYGQGEDGASNVTGCTLLATYLHDALAPTPLTSVTHAAVGTLTTTTPPVSWSGGGADSGSGVQKTEYSIGTSAGDTSVRGWTTVMGPPPQSFGGLSLTDGAYFVNFRVTDNAGNISTVTSSSGWILDTVPPSAPPGFAAFTPTSPSNTSLTPLVSGTASGDTATVDLFSDAACSGLLGSGTRAAFVGGGIAIAVPANSTTTVHARAKDAAGNVSACVLLSSYIHDSTPPTLASLLIGSGAYADSTTVALTAGGVSGGATEYCLLENESSPASCSWAALPFPATVLLGGVNESKIMSGWVRDAAGNVSSRAQSNTLILDTTPPVWTAPNLSYSTSHGFTSTSPIATYSQSATDATAVSYQYALGTGTTGAAVHNIVDWSASTSASFQIFGLNLSESTNYYLRVRALDSAGNVTMSPVGTPFTVTISVAPPLLSAVVPVSPNNDSDSPSIRGLTEASVDSVALYSDVDCTNLLVSGSRAAFENPGLTVVAPANTVLNIYAQATDSDVSKDSACVFLTNYIYDTQAPLPVGTVDDGTQNNSLTAAPLIQWTGGGVDGGAGFNRFEYSIGTAPGLTDVRGWTSAAATSSVSPMGLSLTNGDRYYANIRVVDNVGNISPVVSGDGWVADVTAPALTISEPGPGLLVRTATRVYRGSCESGSDVFVNYAAGASGPASVPCLSDVFELYVSYSGVDGDRTVTISQTDSAGNSAAPVVRTVNWQPTFNLFGDGFDGQVNAIAFANDGSRDLFIGGAFTQYGDASQNRIVRVQSSGERVAPFSVGTGFGATVFAILPAKDGSGDVYVGGSFTSYDGNTVSKVVRLNSDGTLDMAFQPVLTGTSHVYALEHGPSNKIFVGGTFTGIGTAGNYANLVLLNPDGTPDASFDVKTGGTVLAAGATVNSLKLSADGQHLFVGGNFTVYRGVTVNRIMKLSVADGTVAAGWATGATAGFTTSNGYVYSIELAPDNTSEIYAAGAFTAYGGVANSAQRVARLNANGGLIAGGFNAAAGATQGADGVVRAVLAAQDGSNDIYIGGDFAKWRNVSYDSLVRLNSDGTVDSGFVAKGFSASTAVFALGSAPPADNPYYDIVVGGSFTTYGSTGATRLARLNANGTIDVAFATGAGAAGGAVRALLQESDGSGSIYIGGDFTTWSGVAASRIVKILGDGTRDTSFDVGAGFNGTVSALARAPDGDIYVGGMFTTYKGVTVNGIVRLNPDGSIDSGFATGVGFLVSAVSDGYGGTIYTWGGVRAMMIASDGSGDLYVTGQFTKYNNVNASGLIRLNSDGSRDTGFNIGAGLAPVSATAGAMGNVLMQVPDGSGDLLVAGGFTSYNGTNRNRIARLTSTGTLVSSFVPSTQINGIVHAIQPLNDGTGDLYVGGVFTRGLLRMKNNGAVVPTFTFDLKNGTAGSVTGLALDDFGKLFATGGFTTYAGKVVAISSDASLDVLFALGTGLAGTGVTGVGVEYVNDGSGDVYIYGVFTTYNGVSRVNIVRVRGDGDLN